NQLQPSRKLLLQNGFNLVKLFSPEHGLNLMGEDGVKINNSTDELTKLPIISLYNQQLKPLEKDIDDIDIILFDIPDIGCRFYTYLWTMTYILEAAAQFNKPIITLDRPNPISGNFELAEGCLLDEKNCSSFIGRFSIPIRHCCTLAELANYFNKVKNINAQLECITCSNWSRNMFQPDWKITFVPTSPAIQTFNAALYYTGLGFLEATNISEGRGTQNAFEILGAPWLNNEMLCEVFNSLQDEVALQPYNFTPTFSKYKNEKCYGVSLKVKNISVYHPVHTALLLIKTIKETHSTYFAWSTYPTMVNQSGEKHLDKLLGILNSENLLELSFQPFLKELNKITDSKDWQHKINSFLLY
ncbi:MAG TPA: DUF1343 domain-containing protein, partial [Chitinophagaceae bacterium]|nr:DUF1343 domain-containing protein [Chitinophagaceae bacterium]